MANGEAVTGCYPRRSVRLIASRDSHAFRKVKGPDKMNSTGAFCHTYEGVFHVGSDYHTSDCRVSGLDCGVL